MQADFLSVDCRRILCEHKLSRSSLLHILARGSHRQPWLLTSRMHIPWLRASTTCHPACFKPFLGRNTDGLPIDLSTWLSTAETTMRPQKPCHRIPKSGCREHRIVTATHIQLHSDGGPSTAWKEYICQLLLLPVMMP